MRASSGSIPVGVEELRLVPFSEVPVEAHRRNRQIGPAVTIARSPKSTFPVHTAVRRDLGVFGAHASPWTTTGTSIGGRGPSEDGCRPTQTCPVHSAGKSSIGIAWIARSPAAIARIASLRRARHSSPTAGPPGTPSVSSHRVAVRAVVRDAEGPRPLDAHTLALQSIPVDRCASKSGAEAGGASSSYRRRARARGRHRRGRVRSSGLPDPPGCAGVPGQRTSDLASPGRDQDRVAIRIVDHAHVGVEVGQERSAAPVVTDPRQLGEQGIDRLVALDEELEHDPR